MSKLLLKETQIFEAKIQPDQDGKLLVSGVIQRAGSKNQNGRIYPREILEREVKKYHTLIKERRALGELDHPDEGDSKFGSAGDGTIIKLKNASHNIVEMHWEGDDLYATLELLSTPAGNIARELIKSNISVGISSRGMGSVKQSKYGENVVQEDFEIICWDLVSNPSTHGAFVASLTESANQRNLEYTRYNKAHDLIRNIIQEMS